MEKFCPACGRVVPDEAATVCEVDGERLVVLQDEPDLVGSTLEGKYEVIGRLGEGGMGTVYLAKQSSMRREVAVKVLRPQYARNKLAIKRFLREARAASRLTHPNTITVYDSGQTDSGSLFLVMEKLGGRPLSHVLHQEAPFTPRRSVAILAQLCDSLSEAHTMGIVHRDLKAENIFLERLAGNPEHVKVLDFAIAKMTEEATTQATATGMICGTPSYMSPEQAMGRDLTGASDIYSLGVLLVEMLTGSRPFAGDTPMEVMLKHINAEPDPLPDTVDPSVREALDGVVQQMLTKDPADRPPDCQAVKQLLLEALGLTTPGQEAAPAVVTSVREDNIPTKDDPTTLGTGLSPAATQSPLTTGSEWRPQGRGTLVAVTIGVLGGLGALVWIATSGPGDRQVAVSEAAEATPGDPAEKAATVAATKRTAPDPTAHIALTAGTPQAGDVENPGKVDEVAKPAPTGPRPKTVTLVLASTPPGARVLAADGTALGVTPFSLEWDPVTGPVPVKFELDGHQTQAAELDGSIRLAWTVTLDPVTTVETRTPKGSKKATTTGRTRKGKATGRKKKKDRPESDGRKTFGTF